MASKCSRIFNRSSITALKSSISRSCSSPSIDSKSKPAAASFSRPPPSVPSTKPVVNSPLTRFSISRSPVELASMLPLHSTVANARMTSCLSSSSRSCRALSQGTLCCTSPDL